MVMNVRFRVIVLTSALAVMLIIGSGKASNCDSTSKGFSPLIELTGTYKGEAMGLYPGVSNFPPLAHDSAGRALGESFVPLDSFGQQSPSGVWVLLSIGMSNTTGEFSEFITERQGDTTLNPNLRIVDGAQGGQTAAIIRYDTATFWTVIMSRLAAKGLSAKQVQAVWLKEANSNPRDAFPVHAKKLRDDLRDAAQVVQRKFPNVRQVFLSSRIYGGYASSTLNPEPYAYEAGFSVRWLIEAQIDRNDSLNFNPNSGAVKAPWLAWGPYLWADGIIPRQGDSLQWLCVDFGVPDGTHPSLSGRQKVAGMLDMFFKFSPYTRYWYLKSQGGPECCSGTTGNVDGDPDDVVDISDLSFLIDYLFFTGVPPVCTGEGDIDISGSIDISDLTLLTDHLFGGAGLPQCP
jgi:hypothetical protein